MKLGENKHFDVFIKADDLKKSSRGTLLRLNEAIRVKKKAIEINVNVLTTIKRILLFKKII